MVLLRWWFVAVCELGGLGALYWTGSLQKLWTVDVTKLSIVCIAVLLLVTGFIGWLTKQAQDECGKYESRMLVSRLRALMPHVSACWFFSEVLMGLGMTGTVLGFLIMLNEAFAGNMVAQEVMLRVAPGMATICVTTVVGLVCSMLCKAQLVNLDYLLPQE